MKRLIVALVTALSLAYCTPVPARDWTTEEKAWAGAALAFTLTDWLQTRNIAKHPEKWRELNPLLPEHPTLGQVNRHFIRSIAAGAALAHLLPEYRLTILRVVAIVQFGVTAHNAHLGIRMSF